MHQLQAQILSTFKKTDQESLSTSQLLERLFKDQMQEIHLILNDPHSSQDQKNTYKESKAKLHRRLLHHINALIDQRYLKVDKIAAKGQKYYKLYDAPASMTKKPTLPIESYEGKDMVFRFNKDTWISRMDAFLVQSRKIDLTTLQKYLRILLEVTDDVIILNDFEHILQNNALEEVLDVLIPWMRECKEYDKRLCIIIDITNVQSQQSIVSFFEVLLPLKFYHVYSIFDTTGRELMQQVTMMEYLIGLYAKSSRKINIKNDEMHPMPIGIGRAGPYSCDEHEWKKAAQSDAHIIGLGQSSIIIDVKRFFEEYPRAQLFEQMVQKAAKSLFLANSLQRRHAQEYFHSLYELGNVELFSLNRMHIRFWNYDVSSGLLQAADIAQLLDKVVEGIKKYAIAQETIYFSCGMPMRFKIGFASAYRRFDQTNLLLFRAADKIHIKGMTDLYSKRLHKDLQLTEKFNTIMASGEEVRFVRQGSTTPSEIIREFQAILHTYRFRYFCYEFSQQPEHATTLNQFLE